MPAQWLGKRSEWAAALALDAKKPRGATGAFGNFIAI